MKRTTIIALFSAACWFGLHGMYDNEDFAHKHTQAIKIHYYNLLPITRTVSFGIVRAYHHRASGMTQILIAYNDRTYERAIITQHSPLHVFNPKNGDASIQWTVDIYNDTRQTYETRIKEAGWTQLKLD